ncbi:MAG: uracil-DNA glycosylase, partial [Anaerolineales bacterium]
MDETTKLFDDLKEEVISCSKCPRLVKWRQEVALKKRRAYRNWDYWGKPVPGFGDIEARVAVVGLAPGAHGANRTGRMFTGDGSGDFLFSALYRAGFASSPISKSRHDNLIVSDIFITAVCRCVPPKNRPKAKEMNNCIPYLERELDLLNRLEVIVTLGGIAFERVLRIYRQKGYEIPRFKFAHAEAYHLGANLPWLVVSYHPSLQNTQT